MPTKVEKMLDVLGDLYEDDLIEIWNHYCDDYNDDLKIYPIGDLDDWFCGMTATEILEACSENNVDTSDLYFRDTPYYGVQTTSDPTEWINLDDLVVYILDEHNDYDIDEIRDLLDEIDKEEEEEDDIDD